MCAFALKYLAMHLYGVKDFTDSAIAEQKELSFSLSLKTCYLESDFKIF